jgi:hypothetical protein
LPSGKAEAFFALDTGQDQMASRPGVIPLRYQVTGNDADIDLLYGLRGFQLKTYVTLAADAVPKSKTP